MRNRARKIGIKYIIIITTTATVLESAEVKIRKADRNH